MGSETESLGEAQSAAGSSPLQPSSAAKPELKPKKPWRFDTNERYREVVRSMMTMSTATLLLPVFFAREFLAVDKNIPLKCVFGRLIYSSWVVLAVGILSGIFFHYISGKWMVYAWGRKDVQIWLWDTTEDGVEKMLNWSFWISFAGFVAGVGLILGFFLSFDQKTLGECAVRYEQKK